MLLKNQKVLKYVCHVITDFIIKYMKKIDLWHIVPIILFYFISWGYPVFTIITYSAYNWHMHFYNIYITITDDVYILYSICTYKTWEIMGCNRGNGGLDKGVNREGGDEHFTVDTTFIIWINNQKYLMKK